MTWYLGVWGIVTTLAMLVWIAVGVEILREWVAKRQKRSRLPRVADLELEVDMLKQQLKEQRKGANEFGRIIP